MRAFIYQIGIVWSVLILTTVCSADVSALRKFANSDVDATDAIQDAIDASDGFIILPEGKLRISKTLIVNLPETGYFELRGSASSTLVMTASGPAIKIQGTHFKSADPNGFSKQTWAVERMPQIVGIGIEGAHAEADGIEAVGTMQLTLSRVHLRKLRHGVRFVKNNRNVQISDCHIYECSGIGVFYDNVNLHQSNIVGCHISYCDGGGIVSRAGNVRNIHITGCDIESNMAADSDPTANILIDCRGSYYGTAEVAITGCTIQHNDRGPDSANIRIIGNSDPTDQLPRIREGNVTITGNILSDVQTNVHLDNCRSVALTGNTFWMGFEHNLLIENSAHIVIGANNFDRNPRYAYGHATESKNQIVFRDCEDCTLTGIHVSEIHEDVAAVTLQRCNRFNVSALTILDCDLGLFLDDVSNSVFSSSLIQSSQEEGTATQVILSGGINNKFDATFDK